jgi:hypothetical protein
VWRVLPLGEGVLNLISRIRAKRDAAATARWLATELTHPVFVKYLLSFAKEREEQADILQRTIDVVATRRDTDA